jgi:hypothetical protein
MPRRAPESRIGVGKIDLPYVRSYKNRHGTVYFYYRRDGKRWPLRGEPGSEEFLAAYNKLNNGFHPPGKAAEGTLGHLVETYYASPEFAQLQPSTTGQRRGDVLAMRWDAIKDGGIQVRQQKTGATIWVPLHPILATEIAKVEKKGLTIVQRENGGPYTDDGFGSIWNPEQKRVGCAGLPFHGLRKNAAIKLFEAGCTPQQVGAITGHETLAMIQHYGKGSNQKTLAKQAMALLTKDEE